MRLLLMALVVWACGLHAAADELADKGRAILEANRRTIITIQLVVKENWSFGGSGDNGNEYKTEIPGTLIDPSGLTVTALSSTDPGILFGDMDYFADEVDSDYNFDYQQSWEILSVKLLPEGGKEIPAAIVLRDKDLDLAFIRPLEKPAEPMAALSLADDAHPQIFDPVVGISRLGKVGGRVPSITPSRIQAVVEKPRKFYVSHGGEMGTPVFALDGKVVGIGVMRMIKTGGGGMGFAMMSGGDGMLPVIIPAADVAEVAAQAPEKAEEPKPKQTGEETEKSKYEPKSKDNGKTEGTPE